jgi:hypothetical protein
MRAAGTLLPTLLPAELSASNSVGMTRFAMMGDQSLRKAQERLWGE